MVTRRAGNRDMCCRIDCISLSTTVVGRLRSDSFSQLMAAYPENILAMSHVNVALLTCFPNRAGVVYMALIDSKEFWWSEYGSSPLTPLYSTTNN